MQISKQMLEDMPTWMKKQEDLPSGWIYVGDDSERYVLGQPGKLNMLVFGINPSTATPQKLDPTIRKVKKLVNEAGFDGWIMVNLYPLRATDPDMLPQKADKKLLEKNIAVLKAVCKFYPVYRIWAAWGDAIDKRFYLGETLYDIAESIECDQWFYREKMTKSGNPRHPLYMKTGEEFTWFPVLDYVAEWRFAEL